MAENELGRHLPSAGVVDEAVDTTRLARSGPLESRISKVYAPLAVDMETLGGSSGGRRVPSALISSIPNGIT